MFGQVCGTGMSKQVGVYSFCDSCSLLEFFHDIVYSSMGSSAFPKEMIQIHSGSNSFVIDDFKKLSIFSNKISKKTLRRQDKGHLNELLEIRDALKLQEKLFDLDQIYLTHKIAFNIIKEKN